MHKYRIIAGLIFAPLALIIILQIPYYEHTAFYSWLKINTILAYVFFIFLASISHFILAKKSWVKIWQYCAVMFIISLLANFTLSIWSLSGYSSYAYEGTALVVNENITYAGYILEFKNSCITSLYFCFTMGLFWLIAIYNNKMELKNA